MKFNRHLIARTAREWEWAFFVASLVALLFTVAWLLLTGRPEGGGMTPSRPLPLASPRINKAAYAFLQLPSQEPSPEVDLFQSQLAVPDTVEIPLPPPESSPPPPSEPPAAVIQPEPVPSPEAPEEPAAEAWHIVSYDGYRTTSDGHDEGIMRNHTTGETVLLREGHQYRGYMVEAFTQTEITFLTPTGRRIVIAVGKELRVRPRE